MSNNRAGNGAKMIATVCAPRQQRLTAALELCIQKTRLNIQQLADEPKSAAWAADGNYFAFDEGFYEIGNWTSSFFTGMALLAWQETEDEYFLKQVFRLAPYYREKVFVRHRDTHHDLGFLYSLYSVALFKLTGDLEHREVGLRAAGLLSERFNPRGKFLRAWGRLSESESLIGNESMRTDNMAIIDSLMNLPLLYWASKESGDPKHHEIAVLHADTALNCFIRPDNSVNNIYRFDLETGRPLGDPNNTYWARGAAWAIYGFALSHGYTRDAKYLDAAVRLAKTFIANLDDELVPWNDFRDHDHPDRLRDASAGAIAVCGFQEIMKHGVADLEILETQQAMLDQLCSNDYLEFKETCPGVQKHGQGGVNGYTSWGDYFLMEALSRELNGTETFW